MCGVSSAALCGSHWIRVSLQCPTVRDTVTRAFLSLAQQADFSTALPPDTGGRQHRDPSIANLLSDCQQVQPFGLNFRPKIMRW